jgi:hypothetical protein
LCISVDKAVLETMKTSDLSVRSQQRGAAVLELVYLWKVAKLLELLEERSEDQ